MKWKKLILFGDSNTQYGYSQEGKWVSMLSNLLQRQCDVVNRGFSGYTTTHLRRIMAQVFQEFDAKDIAGVVIMVGSNDATHHSNEIQHVNVKNYEENLVAILEYLTSTLKISKETIILVTPPRKHDQKWQQVLGEAEKSTHLDELVPPYAQVCLKLAKQFEINSFDFRSALTEHGNLAELLKDGLHLSEVGSTILYDGLLPIVTEKIVKNLKFNYPYWKDLVL